MTESIHSHFRSSFIQSPRSAICCRFIRKLMALAFVPIVSLRPAFIALSLDPVVARIPGIAPLLVYYEQTWFNSDFPIQMWNVFSQSTRTNNRVEGWHHKLNRAIGHSHPNTHDLISVLNNVQTTTEETLQRARLGAPPPPRRRKYMMLEERLERLQTALRQGLETTDSYLDAVRHLVHQF